MGVADALPELGGDYLGAGNPENAITAEVIVAGHGHQMRHYILWKVSAEQKPTINP